jgi:serine/threonine protein phosphatase PrpC
MKKAANPRFQIGAQFGDRIEVLDLFAAILREALAEQEKHRRFEVPFALLFMCSHAGFSLDELTEFVRNQTPVRDWCKIDRAQKSEPVPVAPDGMFWTLLESCLKSATQYNAPQPSEICRVLAAVGQTLNGKNAELVRWNLELAGERRAIANPRPAAEAPSHSEEVPDPVSHTSEAFIPEDRFLASQRDDERGRYLSVGDLAIWDASFVGPRSAGKSENQDATAVRILDSGAVFALADGVSTSLGARVAAIAIAEQFCRFDSSLSGSWNGTQNGRLNEILDWMDRYLGYLLAHTDSRDFIEICGKDFQPASAKRLLENTRTGKIANMPAALSATLIGGIVVPGEQPGQFRVNLLRVGDGVVEHIDREGSIEPVLEMDPQVLTISTAVGPGPRSRTGMNAKGAILTKAITLKEGEFLLVSSDGLTRGHNDLVTAKLNEILQREVIRDLRPGDPAAVLEILRSVCQKADELHQSDGQSALFADNVSAVLIASRSGNAHGKKRR